MNVRLYMELSFTEKKSIRKNFGKLKEILSIPNLIDVQKRSYEQFLSSKKTDTEKETILHKGLDKVFKDIFPIEEFLIISNIIIFIIQ